MTPFYIWICLHIGILSIQCEEWRGARTYSKIKTETFYAAVDLSVVDQTNSAMSAIQCSLICLRHGSSVTFYYEKEVSKCHCSGVENDHSLFSLQPTTEAVVYGKLDSVKVHVVASHYCKMFYSVFSDTITAVFLLIQALRHHQHYDNYDNILLLYYLHLDRFSRIIPKYS